MSGRTSLRVLVLAQDPAFGGGTRRAAEVAVASLVEAGCETTIAYVATVSKPRLSIVRPAVPRQLIAQPSAREFAIAAIFPELQLVQFWVARRLVRRLDLQRFDRCLIVGGSILHGLTVVGTELQRGVWIGTLVEDELQARRRSLGCARRAVHRVLAPLVAAAEKKVISGARSVAAQSEATADAVEARGLRSPMVIYPAVALEAVGADPDNRAARLRARSLEVLFVGRTSDERKRFDVALDVVGRLYDALPSWQVRFVSTGRPVPLSSGVEHVALGTPDDRQLAAAYAAAHVLLLTSDQEGFGIVVAEALLNGVCVATTPSGGPEHLVDASNGGVVAAAADLPGLLAELAKDPQRWERMSISGRSYAQEHLTIHELSCRLLSLLWEAPDGDTAAEFESR